MSTWDVCNMDAMFLVEGYFVGVFLEGFFLVVVGRVLGVLLILG